MKKSVKVQSHRKLQPPLEIFNRVVRSFLSTYCGDMPWVAVAAGALRARDYGKLLCLADDVQSDLTASVSPDEKCPQKYDTCHKFQVASQFVALVSKYQFPEGLIPGLDPKKAAIKSFLACERRSRRLNAVFRVHTERGTERHWCVPLVRQVFRDVLGHTPFYGEILRKCDFSGGASVLHTGTLTHAARKLLSKKISGGTDVLSYFKHAMWKNEHYRQFFLPSTDTGIASVDRDKLDDALDAAFEAVEYNKIVVVPKKAKSGRTIAKEPEMNNFVQKGIDLEMRRLLRRALGVDLSDQEPNQRFAYYGSLDVSDPYVTLDVKDASNGVLAEAMRSVLPPRWFKLLDHCRSHDYHLEGVVQPYQMFCSMGNGFCFPLESLLFSAIVISAHKHCGAPLSFKVYGDDIICRQSVALVVVECLRAFGFRTNMDKSFIFGRFRESCGANWYRGQDITPGYYKTPVTNQAELHALHNTFSKWPALQQTIRELSPCGLKYCVSEEYADQITDQAFVVPLDVAMASPSARFCRETHSWVFTTLASAPQVDDSWPDMQVSLVGSREGSFYDPASVALREYMVLTAVLRGSDSRSPFHVRRVVSRRTSRERLEPRVGNLTREQLKEIQLLWRTSPLTTD